MIIWDLFKSTMLSSKNPLCLLNRAWSLKIFFLLATFFDAVMLQCYNYQFLCVSGKSCYETNEKLGECKFQIIWSDFVAIFLEKWLNMLLAKNQIFPNLGHSRYCSRQHEPISFQIKLEPTKIYFLLAASWHLNEFSRDNSPSGIY